jgi:hypothetical protein
VEAQHRGRESDCCAAGDRGLGCDVAGRVENAGRQAESRPEREKPRLHGHEDCGRERRARQPCDHGRRRASAMAGVGSDQREPEEDEPANCKRHADHLALGRPRSRPPDEEPQETDSTGRSRLNQRERRQSQRCDVERPAADACHESDQPPGCREQGDQRTHRVAHAQGRQRRRGTVLCEEAPVECRRRRECERQAGE